MLYTEEIKYEINQTALFKKKKRTLKMTSSIFPETKLLCLVSLSYCGASLAPRRALHTAGSVCVPGHLPEHFNGADGKQRILCNIKCVRNWAKGVTAGRFLWKSLTHPVMKTIFTYGIWDALSSGSGEGICCDPLLGCCSSLKAVSVSVTHWANMDFGFSRGKLELRLKCLVYFASISNSLALLVI